MDIWTWFTRLTTDWNYGLAGERAGWLVVVGRRSPLSVVAAAALLLLLLRVSLLSQ